ncbi:MAG: hypothetical protein JXB39_02035 [Deltaproteobacteria bacterium]|nr:hypothetical protein [Deltaproteobacteria bacterium]
MEPADDSSVLLHRRRGNKTHLVRSGFLHGRSVVYARAMGAAGAILLAVLVRPAGAVPVRLPPGEPIGPWREVLVLAGLEPTNCGDPVVEMVDAGPSWVVRVVEGGGEVRRAEVPAPHDADAREAVAWLAASLATPSITPGWGTPPPPPLITAPPRAPSEPAFQPPAPENRVVTPPPRPRPIRETARPTPAPPLPVVVPSEPTPAVVPEPPLAVAAPELQLATPEPPSVVVAAEPPPVMAAPEPPPPDASRLTLESPSVRHHPTLWVELEGVTGGSESTVWTAGGQLRVGAGLGAFEAGVGFEYLTPATLLDVGGVRTVEALGPSAGFGVGSDMVFGRLEAGLSWRRFDQSGERVKTAFTPWTGADLGLRIRVAGRLALAPTGGVCLDLRPTHVHVGDDPEIPLSRWHSRFGVALRMAR